MKKSGLLISLFIIIVFSGCQSTPDKKINPKVNAERQPKIQPPPHYSPPTPVQLTSIGENSEAYFSPDGRKVIYISQGRNSHDNAQVYIMDWKTKSKRRITHQIGDTKNANFHPRGKWIIYSSTTDEIKERSDFIRKALQKNKSDEKISQRRKSHGPYEIYISRLDGSGIRRLTRAPGYDAEASYHISAKKILFTSLRLGRSDLFVMKWSGKHQRSVIKSKHDDFGAFFSPSGDSLLWSRKTNPQQVHIFVADESGRNPRQLTAYPAINWAAVWHPSGEHILFSSNRQDDNFELYTVNLSGLCLRRLTYNAAHDSLPAFSPDGKKILFTSDRSGRNQIFTLDYQPPKGCADQLP